MAPQTPHDDIDRPPWWGLGERIQQAMLAVTERFSPVESESARHMLDIRPAAFTRKARGQGRERMAAPDEVLPPLSEQLAAQDSDTPQAASPAFWEAIPSEDPEVARQEPDGLSHVEYSVSSWTFTESPSMMHVWLNTAATVLVPAMEATASSAVATSTASGWANMMMALDQVPATSLLLGGAGLSVANTLGKTIPDTTAPVFVSAATSFNGTKVMLTYDGALASSTAAKSAFTVTVGGTVSTIASVAVVGNTVELSMATPIVAGQSVLVSYADPSTLDDVSAVQDAAGNDAVSLSTTSVTNRVDTVAPVAPTVRLDGDWTVNPQVTMRVNLGGGVSQDVVMELFPDAAPLTVSNWLGYVNADFYTGLVFHRVISGFMVQGGGYDAALAAKTALYEPLTLETGVHGVSNLTGTLAMARTSDPNSATSQFYINVADNAFLDYASAASPGYAVFGQVLNGMSTVNAIASVATTTRGGMPNVPVSDITLQDVSVLTSGQAYSSSGKIFLGGLETGAQWSYSLDGGGVWQSLTQSVIDLSGLTPGAKSVSVRQVDGAGNVSAISTLDFTLYQPDATQSVLDLATASDTTGGAAGTAQDNITQSTSLALSAVLASLANQDVWLMDQGQFAATATADANGALSWQVNGATAGDHVFTLYDPVHHVRVTGSGGIATSELHVRVL